MSLNRKSRLKADPEKVRAFQQRGRGKLKRKTALAQRSQTNSRPPKQKARIDPDTRARARARSAGLCVACLHRAGVRDVRKLSTRQLTELVERGTVRASRILHHVLPEQTWPHLAEEEDNLVCVCDRCHSDHEFKPGGRMPRAALPAVSLALALRVGAAAYIEATYP